MTPLLQCRLPRTTHPDPPKRRNVVSLRTAAMAVIVLAIAAPAAGEQQIAQYSQPTLLEQRAQLDVRGVALASALETIQRRSGVPIMFSPSSIPDRAITCSCRDRTVGEALSHMLAGTGFTFSQIHRQVVVERARPSGGRAQNPNRLARTASAADAISRQPVVRAPDQVGTVMGRVVDAASGRPLPSVQVYVPAPGADARRRRGRMGRDAQIGTVTDQDGRYRLSGVPAGEVVVTANLLGYGQVEETVTVVSDGTVMLNFELHVEALQLDAVVVSGTAGQARQREVGNAISQISMANVAEPINKLDHLIQGRAAGVSVTEGSGMAGSGAQIRLRGNVSVALSNQPLIYIDGVRIRSDGYPRNAPIGAGSASGNVNASPLNDINPADIDRIEVLKGAAATTLYGTEAAAGVIQIFTKQGSAGAAQWTARIDQGFNEMRPYGYGGNDFLWMDPWLDRGWRQNYSASVRGGTADVRYLLSGAFENNQHVLPNDREEKVSLRGNFTVTPTSSLQIDWNTALSLNDISNTPAGNNSSGLPLNVYRQDRNYFGEFNKELIDQVLDHEILTDITRIISGGTATHRYGDRLVNRLVVGYDYAGIEGRNVRPFGFFNAPQGIIGNRQWTGTTLTVDYAGTFELPITDVLGSSISWGAQTVTTEEITVDARGENFPGPGIPTVSSGSLYRAGESRFRLITGGAFFQSLFNLKDRYFLTLGLRVDGNSAFGEEFGLQPYPKVSASYVISDEPFWSPSWGKLKLRGAYGHAGRAPGAFDAARTWNAVGWGDAPAFRPGNVGNPNLGPERTAETEVGFDAAFLDDRLNVDFTYYSQHTRDALFAVVQTPSEGFIGSQLENVGELKNEGIELAVQSTLVRRRSFGVDLGLTVATNRSELLSMGDASPFQDASYGSGWYYVGQPVPVITNRWVRNPDEIADPDIVEDHHFGPNQPTHTFGVNSTIRLPYDVVLSGRGEYMGGHYMADNLSTGAYRRGVLWPTCDNARSLLDADRAGDLTAWERAWCIQGNVSGSDIYPADFFKLRDVTLQVPVSMLMPGSNHALLSLSARNWFTWRNDDFLVMDPEANNNLGMGANVKSITEHIPPTATVTASLQVSF